MDGMKQKLSNHFDLSLKHSRTEFNNVLELGAVTFYVLINHVFSFFVMFSGSHYVLWFFVLWPQVVALRVYTLFKQGAAVTLKEELEVAACF